jgi:hypothetical protein
MKSRAMLLVPLLLLRLLSRESVVYRLRLLTLLLLNP